MKYILALTATLLASPSFSQNFTTAAEVKPILGMTKGNWVAVREYEGRDLIYFSHLIAWRCGLDGISYGLNGEPAETPLELEPCHEETNSPNAILSDTIMIYLAQPLKSVESIAIKVDFDDGTSETAEFPRKSVLIP